MLWHEVGTKNYNNKNGNGNSNGSCMMKKAHSHKEIQSLRFGKTMLMVKFYGISLRRT